MSENTSESSELVTANQSRVLALSANQGRVCPDAGASVLVTALHQATADHHVTVESDPRILSGAPLLGATSIILQFLIHERAGQSWGAPKHVRVLRARALAAPSTVSLGIVPETTPIHANFSSITPAY